VTLVFLCEALCNFTNRRENHREKQITYFASFVSEICTFCTILMNNELCKNSLTFLFFNQLVLMIALFALIASRFLFFFPVRDLILVENRTPKQNYIADVKYLIATRYYFFFQVAPMELKCVSLFFSTNSSLLRS